MSNDVLKDTNAYKEPSFTLLNRFLRTLWTIIYVIAFRFTPRICHKWRVFVLVVFGAKIGKGCHVYPSARIWAPWKLRMGEFSCLGDEVNCYNMDRIIIGDRTVISQRSELVTGTHDYNTKGFQLTTLPLTIGNDCWIASGAFIHPGVCIGDGAVIGARSVVHKNIPEWSVWRGNPAEQVRSRDKSRLKEGK